MGCLAFRDPYGIRPLSFGETETPTGRDVIVASETVALEGTGHKFTRDVAPGEAVFIDMEGSVHAELCAGETRRSIPACSSTCIWRGPTP